jgi:hypothetical protein
MLGHTGAVSAKGHAVNLVTSRISQVIFSAPDLTGTPLADKVTTSGSFLNIANSVVEFFGGQRAGVRPPGADGLRLRDSDGAHRLGGPGAAGA